MCSSLNWPGIRFGTYLPRSKGAHQGETLEAVVGNLLKSRKKTLAVAEGCTGGRIAYRLTGVPGSSRYFAGGVVCYSNDLKTDVGGVPPRLLEVHGAASIEVAKALAESIRRTARASLGLAVTGLAGPEGGVNERPIGTVSIALADEGGAEAREYRFSGDRDRIQGIASQTALEKLRRRLLK